MKKTIITIAVLGFLISCEKPEPAQNEQPYTPTPAALDLPLHLSNTPYTIPADNPLTKEGIELGRHLFYEPKLSIDNTVSCASCHKQENAFSDPEQFSKGINGLLGKRNSMSLVNLVFQDSIFFWDGRARNLEHQVLFPIEDPVEMNEALPNVVSKLKADKKYPDMFFKAFGTREISGDLIFKAIAQFERSIISVDSKFDKYIVGKLSLSREELNGFNLFRTHPEPKQKLRGGNCGDCHNTVTFMEKQAVFRNNGLDETFTDEGRKSITKRSFDAGKFRVPSLRNIALTAPYMHDGRFKTLEEVLDHYNEHIKQSATLDPLITAASNELDGTSLGLTEKEKQDIIKFLHTLTDSSMVSNPKYSKPLDF